MKGACYEDIAGIREHIESYTISYLGLVKKSLVKKLRCHRLFGRSWIIACTNHGDLPDESLIQRFRSAICTLPPPLHNAELFSGSTSLGRPLTDINSLAMTTHSLLCELGMSNISCHVYKKIIERTIESKHHEAREIKVVVGIRFKLGDVYESMVIIDGVRGISSRDVEELMRSVIRKFKDSLTYRRLSPLRVGKAKVVLNHEATSEFLNSLSSLLRGDEPKLQLGTKLFVGEAFDLYDDPRSTIAPSTRFFDDESIPTFKRLLIDKGVIADYHHTILTALKYCSRPGSAFGISEVPMPTHTTLLVEGGDWRLNEIIEELREGFVIDKARAQILHDSIVLRPYTAYEVRNGEIVGPIRIRLVKIPIIRPLKVFSVSRLKRVIGNEYKSVIAPAIALEAYVE